MAADILAIAGFIFLLFGGRKLPELMGIGKEANAFKQKGAAFKETEKS